MAKRKPIESRSGSQDKLVAADNCLEDKSRGKKQKSDTT
jgi:hypothetical protein